MATTLIGIDCSTKISKNGLVRGQYKDSHLEVTDLLTCRSESQFASLVTSWIKEADQTLLCLDAPLGWPEELGNSLIRHKAGERLSPPANNLFRRGTDKMIKSRIGKQPLDVGSNLIARTAHHALGMLEKISMGMGEEILLAWEPQFQNKFAAIEVYPSATLLAHDISHSGYKKQKSVRKRMLSQLQDQLVINPDTSILLEKDDVLDACVCVLAGMDFLKGNCIYPEDIALAKKEGWIWVRDPILP